MKLSQFSISVIALTLAACGQATNQGNSQQNNGEQIPALHERVTYQGMALSLSSPEATRTNEEEARFKYLVSVEAPQGLQSKDRLQATNFHFANGYGFVSYNTAGEIVEGALDIVSIKRNAWADIISSFSFQDAEFADVKVSGKYAYLVGAENSENQGAVLVVMNISKPKSPEYVGRVSLPGYYATSLVIENKLAFVTSGDNAGVVVVDLSEPSKPQVKETYDFANALSLVNANDSLFVIGGKETTSIYFGLDFEQKWEVSGRRSDAPARMVVKNDHVYTNAQYSGLTVISLENQNIVATKDLRGTGNGLDVFKDFVFLAQGEMGLQVVEYKQNEELVLLGSLDFPDDRGSANQVQFSEDHSAIFLADGLGGFRVVHFDNPCATPSKRN